MGQGLLKFGSQIDLIEGQPNFLAPSNGKEWSQNSIKRRYDFPNDFEKIGRARWVDLVAADTAADAAPRRGAGR